MEKMYAPWRFKWIKESANGVTDCFLCDALKEGIENDRENLILIRRENAFVIMNRYPYSNGHLMVCPNRHLHDLRQMEPYEWEATGELTQVCMEAMERTLHPHGFNLGWNMGTIAGAGLEEHIHLHIVPRWKGDTNFMPVLGETKVISQDMWECYDQLKAALDSL